MPHLAGKKIAKSHSTVIEEAEKLLRFLTGHPLVEKIITGEIKHIEHGPRRIKIVPVEAGLKLTVRGINARQHIFIYTLEKDLIARQIEEFWQKKNRS